MIQFQCPSCQTPIETPDSYAGRSARCPTCNRRIRVPRDPRSATVSDDSPSPDDSSASSAVFRIEGRTYQVRAKLEGLLIAADVVIASSVAVFAGVGLTAPAYSPWFAAGLVATGFALFGALLVLPGYYSVRRSHGLKTGERLAFVSIALAAVLVVVFLCVATVANLSADRTPCHARLKAVGQALREYVVRNEQLLPPKPDTLVEQGYLAASKLTCRQVSGVREGTPTYEPRSYLRNRQGQAVIDLKFQGDESRRFPGDLMVLMDGGVHEIQDEKTSELVPGHYVLTLDGDVYYIRADRKADELNRQRQVVGRVLRARQIEDQQRPGNTPPIDRLDEPAPP